jgi:hypothetical protein
VGVDHAADDRKGKEQPAMGLRVRRRVKAPFDLASLKVDDDHVVGRESLVIDPTWLDCEYAERTIDRACIAEGEIDEAMPR